MKNLIKTQLDEATRTKITGFVTSLENEVAGKLVAMTPEERSRYGAINEQNKLLVNKTRDYRQNNPALSSPDVDWDEFEADYQARVFVEGIAQRLESLAYQFRSTKILHDNDNWQDALDDYAHAQYRSGAGASGFAEKVGEMKQFFPRTGKSPAPPAPDGGSNG